MTSPITAIRYQGKAHKRKGASATGDYNGAYTSELFAFIDATTGANREIVAAVAGAKIRVLSYSLSGPAGGAATATFKSANTAISPLLSLGANGWAAENDNNGLFQTASAEALNINTSATVGVRVTYILVD
jgi:hypothetical protein